MQSGDVCIMLGEKKIDKKTCQKKTKKNSYQLHVGKSQDC